MPQEINEKNACLGVKGIIEIDQTHDLSKFDCGEPSINSYLLKALSNHNKNNARVFVLVLRSSNEVIGFYTLSNSEVIRELLPKKHTRNSPASIPTITLGRLGVSKEWHKRGFGESLLQDAFSKCITASKYTGVRAIIIHPLNDQLAEYYKRLGFIDVNEDSSTLFIPIEHIKNSL